MPKEIINGTVYINGYLCNDAGQPITMNNGYSSEEEHEAHIAYKMAKQYAIPKRQFVSEKKEISSKKRKPYLPPAEDEWWK
ncbi:MAG: hypothetical protein CVV59_01090 [Tenericutes bacterium HGW-Tenericutes-4]|jgi:hypothetical protein|nr:MAG: hypothetical protein CVV59_01090 [Tenericutes bacterium HGW-Tenericutes-4]